MPLAGRLVKPPLEAPEARRPRRRAGQPLRPAFRRVSSTFRDKSPPPRRPSTAGSSLRAQAESPSAPSSTPHNTRRDARRTSANRPGGESDGAQKNRAGIGNAREIGRAHV